MKQQETNKSKYWLDQIADQIVAHHPKGEIIISSGHSPSGTYHIGTIREIATASALTWAVRQRDRQAKHVDFVDDFDVLRKLPADLPETLRPELGKPLYKAASPEKGVSYGEYFYRDLLSGVTQAEFAPDQTFFASITYGKEHRYTEAIAKALAQIPKAREIIERVSHRRLPSDWAPVQILSDNDRLTEWTYIDHDLDRQTVTYRDQKGNENEISFAEGRVKLDWRLDWPARWWMWGVSVEPFGRDHATKGGSYDTGRELVREIFGGEAPLPVPYEFINMTGQTVKLSKSAGNVITVQDALDVMPPELLRYFIARPRPDKLLLFDTGLGLMTLIDEFAAVQADEQHPFRDAFRFAVAGRTDQIISSVSFRHLVQVYQAAQGDTERVMEILTRTGYESAVANERSVIERELTFVENWLHKYAPEAIKFEVQDTIPATPLTDAQRGFLAILAAAVEARAEVDGQTMHELIYAAKEQADLPPQAAFQALYRVILHKEAGPKAGWFLASLDRNWLIKRLHLKG